MATILCRQGQSAGLEAVKEYFRVATKGPNYLMHMPHMPANISWSTREEISRREVYVEVGVFRSERYRQRGPKNFPAGPAETFS